MDYSQNQNQSDAAQVRRQTEVAQVPEETSQIGQQASLSSSEQPSIGASQIEEDEGGSGFSAIIKIVIGLAVIIFVALFLIWFILSKVGGGSVKKTTITYWGLWEDEPIMQPIINQFEKENPSITVNYIKQDPKQYTQRLLTRIQNGSGPDIFRFHSSWIPMMLPVLAPLPKNVISTQDFVKNYYPFIQQDLVRNGAIYGVPLGIDTLALFANTDLLQKENVKVPTNWTDFITASKTLTLKDAKGKIKIAGAALGTYDNITHAPDIISLLFLQNGVDFSNLGDTQKNVSDALSFYTSFATGDGNVWDPLLDPSITMFAAGKLGLYFGYSWDIFQIKALNPNINFSINPVPHLPGRNQTISSYWIEGVSNKSLHQKEAMLFMNFLTSKDTLQQLYLSQSRSRLFGEPYPRLDLADSVKGSQFVYPFLTQGKNASSSFFAGETQQDDGINYQMNNYLSKTINDMLQGTSPQSAADTLGKGVAQVLQQYAPPAKSNP